MTAEVREDPARLWPERWAVHAAVKADTIEQQMRVARAGREADPRADAAARAIETLVAAARQATMRRGWWPWRGLRDRWRGTSVERAYLNLHAAEIFLVDLLPDEQVEALVPDVIARAHTVSTADDPRRRMVDGLRSLTPGGKKRALLQGAMKIGYDASDQLHGRVRSFRNILMAAAVLIGLLMAVLVGMVAYRPDALPMCFTPTATAPAPAEGQPPAAATVCPSGDHQAPSGGDVMIVAGLGVLGGALAAAFGIRHIRGTSTPYDIPIALALLKVPSGALTAVAGILLLGGNFVPGLSELDSQRQILAYAIVFGYAQQLATRFIDTRAQAILDSVPSKDPEAKQPVPSVPPPEEPPPAAAPATAAAGQEEADRARRPAARGPGLLSRRRRR